MRLFDRIKKRYEEESISYKKYTKEEITEVLDREVFDLFPKEGYWTSVCFTRGNYLQCHLRDNLWLADWFKKKLENKDICILKLDILSYIESSKLFEEKRHEYELEIVRWQIKWMKSGGEGWLMPNGTDEFDLMFNPDIDKIFRAGVVKTLTKIGMDREVVEEGIEIFSNLWREYYMKKAFQHAFEPIGFMRKTKLEPAIEEHKQNWLKMRRYEYYIEHQKVIDEVGSAHKDMFMSGLEVNELRNVLYKQNEARAKVVTAWKNMKDDDIHYNFGNLCSD